MMRLAILLLALGAHAVAAAPRLVPAAHEGRVVVLAEPGLEGTAHELATAADAALARISADLAGLPSPPAIEVHLVRDSEDLAGVAPPGRGAPKWAIGVAYPDLGVISVAMRRGANVVDPVSTLHHELAHLALGAALGDRAPHWLHEGFAYQHSAGWTREQVETLAGMVWFDSIIPLSELDGSFPQEELPAHRAYAESYDFVGFLAHRGRWEDASDRNDRYPFRKFLAELGRGADIDTASNHAFGRPIRDLFEEWRADLHKRYMFMPASLIGLGLWILVGLLVVLAWWRRRRQNRHRIAQWDRDDDARRAAALQVIAPPYVPWPGEDPFDDPDDRLPGDPPDEPRLMN